MSSTVPYKTDGVLGTDVYPGLGATQHAKGTITSAELLALFTTVKTLVAAPGAGKILVFKSIHLFLDYESAAYAVDAGDNLEVRYTGKTGQQVAEIETDGFLTLTEDASVLAVHAAPAITVTSLVLPVVNSPLVLFMSGSEVITGDSPLYYDVEYEVIKAAIDGN